MNKFKVTKMANQKKHTVIIRNTLDYFGGVNNSILACPDMTTKEIKQYMDKINGYTTIPVDSCLHHIKFSFCYDFQRNILLHGIPEQKRSTTENDGGLSIYVTMKECRKCPAQTCFNNIKSGNCKDKFVQEIIGKKLFEDKYTKQK